jgi:hypothetical protein
MVTEFAAAMAKLQVLGQDSSRLIDCSDVRIFWFPATTKLIIHTHIKVVPVPKPFTDRIKFPPTFTQSDVEIAVSMCTSRLGLPLIDICSAHSLRSLPSTRLLVQLSVSLQSQAHDLFNSYRLLSDYFNYSTYIRSKLSYIRYIRGMD